MRFTTKKLGLSTGGVKIIVMDPAAAFDLGVKQGDRVRMFLLTEGGKRQEPGIIAIVDFSTSSTLITREEIGLYDETVAKLGIKSSSIEVELMKASRPRSFEAIKRKIDGHHLTAQEILEIVKDCTEEKLLAVELAAFIIGVHIKGLTDDEIVDLTYALTNSGEILDFGVEVYDKHSTGGVPGNKISLIIVPIIAAAGLFIPKTSTRAITSPSGTADSFEVLAPVTFVKDKALLILENQQAGIFWAGAMNSSPAADVLINIQKTLNLDPLDLMIASIISKKMSMGVKKLVLDIPVGAGTKFSTVDEGRKFAFRFKEIARRVGIDSICVLTSAKQPIGHAVGPALEAREAIRLLENPSLGPSSLLNKSTDLAGILLEMAGKASEGHGKELALDILKSGKAWDKMKAIIKEQGGDPNVSPEMIEVGPLTVEIHAEHAGIVANIDNKAINAIAKLAGCPGNKAAGIEIEKKIGAKIKVGDVIFRIYASNQTALDAAKEFYNAHPPIGLGSMTIETI